MDASEAAVCRGVQPEQVPEQRRVLAHAGRVESAAEHGAHRRASAASASRRGCRSGRAVSGRAVEHDVDTAGDAVRRGVQPAQVAEQRRVLALFLAPDAGRVESAGDHVERAGERPLRELRVVDAVAVEHGVDASEAAVRRGGQPERVPEQRRVLARNAGRVESAGDHVESAGERPLRELRVVDAMRSSCRAPRGHGGRRDTSSGEAGAGPRTTSRPCPRPCARRRPCGDGRRTRVRTGERPLRKLRVVGAVAVELSSTALTRRAPRYVEACSRRRSQNNVASLRASLRAAPVVWSRPESTSSAPAR